MKTLNESLKLLDEHYLETLKYASRNFDINLSMLEKGGFDKTLYGEAKAIENLVNNFEVELKEDAIITMARFQPAAKNLRKLVMLINSARVIERIGDLLKAGLLLIKEIEEDSIELTPVLKNRVYPVAKKIREIFQLYIDAFLREDIKLLYDVLYIDEQIDEAISLNAKYYLDLMKKSSDNVDGGSKLLILDRKFERLSDHIIHLVSDLIYILNGKNTRKDELEILDKVKIKATEK